MSDDLTLSEFRSAVLAILEKQDNHPSLESHLLSLWMVIGKYRDTRPSYSLFAKMIEEAFNTPPGSFDNQWLVYKKSVPWGYQDGKYMIQGYQDKKFVIIENDVSDFEILKRTILFQVADLHQIPDEKMNDPHSFFGITSPTGARWYNLHPYGYWECATAGMDAQSERMEHTLNTCDWVTLAGLLSLGQLYE